MNFKEFCEKIYTAITEFYGEEVKAEIKEVRKNNGVVLTSLLMTEGDTNVSPSIYMDGYYCDYIAGKGTDKIILDIINLYEEIRKKPKVDMEFFVVYEEVRDRICYKLINYYKNKEMLEGIPHIKYLNMAIVFYYAFNSPILGDGTITISNAHIENWNVSTEELFRQANENTPRLFELKIYGIEELVTSLAGKSADDLDENMRAALQLPMHVLTNTNRIMGAVSVLYPGALHKLAIKEGKNLFLLPSSVHEMIALADTGQDIDDLQRMVKEVNSTQVAEEEILADSVYYYDKNTGKIELLT